MPEPGEFVMDGHLGGYVAGGDPATWYPDLWKWLVEWLHVESVIDVGCGDGQALQYFEQLGCLVLGVEGMPQEHPRIVQHDYTTGPFKPIEGGVDGMPFVGRPFDLAWSCEFVEHVEEPYVANFLATFMCAERVLMTHAAPGQAGHHHVNCRDADYWIGALDSIGFSLNPTLTEATRKLAGRNANPWNHYVRSGLAFERRS